MARDEARILINLGKEPFTFELLEGEEVELASRETLSMQDRRIEVPPMTIAILLSTPEESENRQVSPRKR